MTLIEKETSVVSTKDGISPKSLKECEENVIKLKDGTSSTSEERKIDGKLSFSYIFSVMFGTCMMYVTNLLCIVYYNRYCRQD